MSRIEEYHTLIEEIDQPVPELDHTLERAKKRLRRRNRVVRPLMSMAAAFALFVIAVNCSTKVAYACSQIPILRELAEAVRFSRSLTDAVENEYVQPIELVQENNGVKASVEYLIVDQKQVNVFFRLESEVYTELNVEPEVRMADGSHAPCAYGLNAWDVPNGELQSVTIDFIDEDVPEALRLKLDLTIPMYAGADFSVVPEASVEDDMLGEFVKDTEYVAQFEFLLEFDPQFTAVGKVFVINQTVELDGQSILIREMEVYPSHLRVNVEEGEDNTAWLQDLDFYIKTDWGMKFDTVSNGISATGLGGSERLASYRADSTYFYEADHLEIVITGATWLDKDKERVHLNLLTGEVGELPEHMEFCSATKREGGWLVEFMAPYMEENHMYQLLSGDYYDAEGNKYYINAWSGTSREMGDDGKITHFTEEVALKDYSHTEVWLGLHFTSHWLAEKPVSVVVQQ